MPTEHSWKIYKGLKQPDHRAIANLPSAPSWRKKSVQSCDEFEPTPEEVDLVNAALYLRRPLLITGKPGVGKSTLAKCIAHELGLGDVLTWYITTQSKLEDALYNYDALARLHDSSLKQSLISQLTSITNQEKPDEEDIGKYITLGPLGTAFKSEKIRVILIDEIDKSDVDLPNNLLHVLEDNRFLVPELKRSHIPTHQVNTFDGETVAIDNGEVEVDPDNFPLIIMTSNGEREFPPAFMRRCLHLTMQPRRGVAELEKIISKHMTLNEDEKTQLRGLVEDFDKKDTNTEYLSTDQLLNAVFLRLKGIDIKNNEPLLQAVWKALSV